MGLSPSPLDDQFEPPRLARLLHRLPHLNITLHRVNDTFDPTSDVYLESLGILASVPASLLILCLLGLLLYLLTRCCDRKPRPAKSITCLKVVLSLITVLCCGAIGLGLYGNDDLHNALLQVLSSGRQVDALVTSVWNQTSQLESTLTSRVRPQLLELEDIFDGPVRDISAGAALQAALRIVQGNTSVAAGAAGDMRRPLGGISLAATLNVGDFEYWESIRWPTTLAALAVLLSLCAILLVGVARHSRCALITFSVSGLLAVTASWLLSGLYLSSSVALADLCMDPAAYLASQAPPYLPPEVLLYYTQCESARANPFTQRLRESQKAVAAARSSLTIVSKISLELFQTSGLKPRLAALTTDLNSCERLLTGLTALLDCRAVHGHFLTASRSLCDGGLMGLALMLAAGLLAAFLLTVMVWVDSHTWIYIRKKRDYTTVDEADPFLPPQQASQAVAARTLQRSNQHQQQAGSLPRPPCTPMHQPVAPPCTPPPAYGTHAFDKHDMSQDSSSSFRHDRSLSRNSHRVDGAGHLGHIGHRTHASHGSHTLGRLPSHGHSPPSHFGSGAGGPNNGKYATLSKQCKTLESSDFY
ncbi:protein tweety-like [Ctenocephalides felis]|uniref:protein tweety-like n=1 Tax=Ctenocephalides felis TaxID=7515 RepID=UPI000E6E583C|nr:protein tweety-like [Ctenocephalides felis]